MKKFLSIAMVAVMLVALCSTVFAADGPTMTVGTVDGYRGEKVVVPVVVSNNPGIAAATVTITYDTNNLKLNKVETGADFPGLLERSAKIVWVTSATDDDGNKIDVTANSAIFNLTFTVLDTAADGNYPIELTIAERGGATNLAEQNVTFTAVNGAIKVAEKPAITTPAPAPATTAAAATTTAGNSGKKDSPKTADAGVAVAAVALAAAACFVATKKRK
jgi:hypothetical protein